LNVFGSQLFPKAEMDISKATWQQQASLDFFHQLFPVHFQMGLGDLNILRVEDDV
jgi:hypothetical protein